jgi:predicted RNA-binding protein with PIN domain
VAPDPVLPEEVAVPSATDLLALDSDRWAALLPHVRAVLAELDQADLAPDVARLRDAPTSRLVSGRRRTQLCELLATGGVVWEGLVARVTALDPVPEPLRWLLTSAPKEATEVPADRPSAAGDRDRERLRRLRDQRDTWQRRAEGAEARADRLDRELGALRGALDEVRDELAAVRGELDTAADDRRRAVERERRRRETELEGLQAEIAALRRAEEDRRVAARRRVEAREQAEREAAQEVEAARRAAEARRSLKVVPGRPTQLPRGIAPETTEAAKVLLHAGRLVLIDGYNVTLQHRKHLDLEAQRTWLLQRAADLASRRGIRPIVVFDGERSGGGRPPGGLRGVEVRFTPTDITADDEIVLAVEGTDEPVVVVTDDRELRARVMLGGADLIGTRSFLGAIT